ncbi:MAG: tyrosine-type recombinase/integrase, partial [Actinomycetota bacterium]|nr:tyrosine-type recombinase/integrase [Actinomycetota bacterium]
MSVPAFAFDASSFIPTHCGADEYAAFVQQLPSGEDWRRKLVRFQTRFAVSYPDLGAWFDTPLRERIGWQNQTTQSRRRAPQDGFDATAGWVNHNARPYLIYLALTGRLRLDWPWLLGVGVLKPWVIAEAVGLPLVARCDEILALSRGLGLPHADCRQRVHWTIARLVLHRGDPDIDTLAAGDIDALRALLRNVAELPQIEQALIPQQLKTASRVWGTYAFQTGVALFHAGVIDRMPPRAETKPAQPLSTRPQVAAVMDRYVAERRLIDRPGTVMQINAAMRRLSTWIDQSRPDLASLAELDRSDLLEFLTWLIDQRKALKPAEPISTNYRRMIIWNVMAMFRYAYNNEWENVPARPPLITADVPRTVERVPRYIPDHELGPVMDQLRALDCAYQRCALLVARWSGARRGEIRRLHLDCLDTYTDGTARLRLAAGKSRKERTVPIHDEAAEAIRTLLAIRGGHRDRGIYDRDLGHPVRYLFLRKGRLASTTYLFEAPLAQTCTRLGLVGNDGKPLITA